MLVVLKETVSFLEQIIKSRPKIAIILGTGLGDLVNEIEITQEILYKDIPHFPISTVQWHAGKLIVVSA